MSSQSEDPEKSYLMLYPFVFLAIVILVGLCAIVLSGCSAKFDADIEPTNALIHDLEILPDVVKEMENAG